MKRSALSVLLAAALLCHLTCTAQAQAKRSWTDSGDATRWLANDALTFALDVYEILQEASNSDDTIYLAQADDIELPQDDEAKHNNDDNFASESDTSGCGWTCYPSDYGCFSYDYAYRSPTRLIADGAASDDEDVASEEQSPNDTSLIELQGDAYPCMGNSDFSDDYAIPLDKSIFEVAADALHTLVDAAKGYAHAKRVRGEALMQQAGHAIVHTTRQGISWLNDRYVPQLPTGQELVIRPLIDIDPSLPNSSTFQFADATQPDYEWQVALDYYGEYGCPNGVWDQPSQSASLAARYSPSMLNYWTARLTAQTASRILSRSAWMNTAHEAIAALRVRHSEMIASIEPAVPEIPLQEFMFDNSTYVTIEEDRYETDRVASGASVRSLSQAVLSAVRQSWTAQAAAVGIDNITR